MQQAKTLRDKSVEDLRALDGELSREIFELRNESRMTRKLEKPHLLREKKKDRARVLTVLRQMELKK
jgi:large subunit ribosomal protein L29